MVTDVVGLVVYVVDGVVVTEAVRVDVMVVVVVSVEVPVLVDVLVMVVVVVGVVLRVVVKVVEVVTDVVWVVVGVVMVHSLNRPPTKSLMALFSVLLVASQSVLSMNSSSLKQVMSSVRPLGPVYSLTMLFSAAAVSSQFDPSSLYSSILSAPSVLHFIVPVANGHAASILLRFTT